MEIQKAIHFKEQLPNSTINILTSLDVLLVNSANFVSPFFFGLLIAQCDIQILAFGPAVRLAYVTLLNSTISLHSGIDWFSNPSDVCRLL